MCYVLELIHQFHKHRFHNIIAHFLLIIVYVFIYIFVESLTTRSAKHTYTIEYFILFFISIY